MIQLVCIFSAAGPDFAGRSRPAMALLAAQPGCLAIRLARSTEDAQRWMLTAEFPSFAGYRAALSPFEVRTTVIPWLSEADQGASGVFEVALSGPGGALNEHELLVDPESDW